MTFPLKIGFRADAGPSPIGNVGLGHIVRCTALARALAERGAACWFRSNELGQVMALREGFSVIGVDQGWPARADVWVVDLQEGCPPETAQQYRQLCNTLVIMNGVGYSPADPARFHADLVVYQGVCDRPYSLDWTGYEGQWFEGAEYVILRPAFCEHRCERTGCHDPPRLFLSGGGTNKGGMLDRLAGVLSGEGYDLRAVVGQVDGDAYRRFDALGVDLYEMPHDYAGVMAWADAAVIAYGMTAFECLCLGLPVAAVSLTGNHLEGADIAERRSEGALLSIGLLDEVSDERLRRAVAGMVEGMHEGGASGRALRFVDSKGLGRVVDKIVEVAHGA